MQRRISLLIAASAVISVLNACADAPTSPRLSSSSALFAKGGGNGGGNPAPTARCATLAVTNNPQSVRRSVMPDIKYNIENCGSETVSTTLSVVETTGFLSELCPSPVAAPVVIALAAKQKLSGTRPVFRGPCGFTSNVNGTLVDGINRWQGHNLLLTLTDNATGVVYGTAVFVWQDILNPGL